MKRSTHPERGSVLLVTFILLAVLAATGAAAVLLSSRGRLSAGAQAGYDAVVECANAAQAKLWASIGVHGHGYYRSPPAGMVVESMTLAGGKELAAPAHIDSGPLASIADAMYAGVTGTSDGLGTDQDSTNTLRSSVERRPGGGGEPATIVTARCRDLTGRVHEVEFSFRFSL
jgi:hypothetical protein